MAGTKENKKRDELYIHVDHTINSARSQKLGCRQAGYYGVIYTKLIYGGPEGSFPIAFLFKRFLCLSDL